MNRKGGTPCSARLCCAEKSGQKPQRPTSHPKVSRRCFLAIIPGPSLTEQFNPFETPPVSVEKPQGLFLCPSYQLEQVSSAKTRQWESAASWGDRARRSVVNRPFGCYFAHGGQQQATHCQDSFPFWCSDIFRMQVGECRPQA